MTGPLEMMWVETDRDIVATLGDFGRDYERSEEPTPRTKKFGQDPECSCNDASSANTEPNDTKYNKSFIFRHPLVADRRYSKFHHFRKIAKML